MLVRKYPFNSSNINVFYKLGNSHSLRSLPKTDLEWVSIKVLKEIDNVRLKPAIELEYHHNYDCL